MQKLANTTDEKVKRFQERLNFSKRLSESHATIKGVNHLIQSKKE